MFIFNSISINNVNISTSQGIQSAAISLYAQKVNKIKISHVNLNFLQIIFDSELQKSGAIYIDCSESLSTQININKIRAENFFSFGQGGLFYIKNGNNQANFLFSEIEVKDYFSTFGSLFYIVLSQKQETQNIKITKIISYCTQFGWNYFIQRYLQEWSLDREFQLSLSSNISLADRYQIYIQFSQLIEIDNLILHGLIQESAIFLENITNVIVHKTQIFSSSIHQQLFKILFFSSTSTDIKQSFQIYNLEIFNIKQTSSTLTLQAQFNTQEKPMKCSSKVIKAPSHLESYNNNTIYNSMELITLNQSGIIFIKAQYSQFFRSKIMLLTFNNINYSECIDGLLSVYLLTNLKFQQSIQNIMIENSQCGQLGCLNLIQVQPKSAKITQLQQVISLSQLFILNYICKNNTAINGTCLNFQNFDVQIISGYFIQNNASLAGGAIYSNQNSQFVIEKSLISENSALFGGGIYLNKLYPLLYEKFKVLITQNQAFFNGQNVYSSPERLFINFGQLSQVISVLSNEQTKQCFIEEFGLERRHLIFRIETDTLLYPNGQNVSLYKYFDWKSRKYLLPNLNFKLQAITNKGDIVNELENSYCTIESRPAINLTLEFSANYTNLQTVYYDDITNDFNLDNLTIYFENGQLIELQFNCSCIKVPIYNQNYPYNIINYLDYLLRIKFKPLECQLGEIFNVKIKACEVCNSDQGFFNLQLKETQCKAKDDLSTISVTPAQLQLRQDYWRPYFDSYQTSYCINNPSNCKGGWIEGDQSCIDGHIGALCEQCDIYNIRGDGKFSKESQYVCSSCQGKVQNILIICFLCIETLVSILIAAQSNLSSIKEQLVIIRMRLLGLRVIQKINQRAILIKILTNYLQIIGYINTFQLQFSFDFEKIINFASNPTKQLVYSSNCWLSENFSLQIHYLNMIFQLILPFCYVIIFFGIYFIGNLIKYLNYSKSIITATLIYIYIYFQPTLITNLVQLISYREISDFYWIEANVAYRYDTKIHYYWIFQLFLPTLFCIFFFIPLYFFQVLLKNELKLGTKTFRLQWGYLYSEYNQNAYLWEVLKIVQKELLILFLSYFEDNIKLKSVIACLLLLTYLEFNLIYKPYFSSKLNNLDFQSTNACFISIVLALSINQSQKYTIQFLSIILSYLLFIINFHFIFQLGKSLMFQFFNSNADVSFYNFTKLKQNLQNLFPQLQKNQYCQRFLSKNNNIQKKRKEELFRKLKLFVQLISKQTSDVSEFKIKFPLHRVFNKSEHQIKQISCKLTQLQIIQSV